jgi:serine phosphatase RsbU (regulator of sigma subunit)
MRHLPLLLSISVTLLKSQPVSAVDTVKDSVKIIPAKAAHRFLLRINSLGDSKSLLLNKNWLYSVSDKAEFKDPDFDDSGWDTINPQLSEADQKRIGYKGIGWFRLHLLIDSTLDSIPLSFYLSQEGASELYLNGKKINEFGKIGTSEETQERDNAENEIIFFHPDYNREIVIAIRYSNYSYEYSYNNQGDKFAGFEFFLDDAANRFARITVISMVTSVFGVGLFVFFTTLALVHFLLWIFYRARRSNLFYTLFSLLLAYLFLDIFLSFNLRNPGTADLATLFAIFLIPLFFISMLVLIYSLFYEKFPRQMWAFLGVGLVCSLCFVFKSSFSGYVAFTVILGSSIEVLRVIFVAIRKKKKGSGIIGAGFSFFALFFIVGVAIVFFKGGLTIGENGLGKNILFTVLGLTIVSIPLSMSIFLAWDFSSTNKTLKRKLDEVESLSAKTIEQEKEKQKILETQKETLEQQVEERTHDLNEKKKEIEEKNKDITDSINYAQRIQQAILPTDELRLKIFPQSFVLFMPRDIVSGDFFFIEEVEGNKIIICADCTGHGVPGALMSMIGSNLLHQVIVERKVISPEKILGNLHKEVKKALKQQTGSESKDGMDIAICVVTKSVLHYAGAQRPLLVRKGAGLEEIKADKNSIGGSYAEDEINFTLHSLPLPEVSEFYLFSDGFPDQFGGPKGKKFKFRQLHDVLLQNSSMPIQEQKEMLKNRFMDWKGKLEQIDDVCVIGVSLKP